MGAPGKKKVPANSNKSRKGSNKKASDCGGCGKKAEKVTVPPENSLLDPLPPPDPCAACDPCSGQLATGEWGIPYTDAAGTRRCLKFTGTGAKYLKGDANGPYWANS